MVFDGVVRAALEVLRDDGPLILLHPVLDKQNEFLFQAPLVLLDARVQVVVPPLATLFANASREVMGDMGPFLSAIRLNQREHQLVFVLGPGTLHQLRVKHLLPTVEALDISAPLEALRNLLPVLTVVFLDSLRQLLVLFGCPVALVSAILVLGGPSLVNGRVGVLTSDDHLLGHLVKLLFARACVKHPRHQRSLVCRHGRLGA